MPTKIELCNASDLDVGAVLKVEKNDLTLAVFNLNGEFFVTDDHCTHGPGSLSEGFVEGDVGRVQFSRRAVARDSVPAGCASSIVALTSFEPPLRGQTRSRGVVGSREA